MHVDECDVTFNFGLTDSAAFTGSDLVFCGMFGSEQPRKHLHTYSHVKVRETLCNRDMMCVCVVGVV